MSVEERHLRADAERNRRRLLEAAQTLFRERGLEVGVAEIAEAAGVGRGTLFRNFACKEDLIAAIVAERMHEVVAVGQALLDAPDSDPEDALFQFLGEMVGRQHVDRGLFEALDDTWLARDEIRAGHAEVVGMVDRLLTRAQESGSVRPDVGAMDVLMLFKGACAAAAAFAQADSAAIDRQLDLIRASITIGAAAAPLRGRAPTLEDIERGLPETERPARRQAGG
jgi:AcrR family transcriptional regulator